jgi:hypothetical protein
VLQRNSSVSGGLPLEVRVTQAATQKLCLVGGAVLQRNGSVSGGLPLELL